MDRQKLIEIKLKRRGISPATVPIKELVALLSTIDEAVAAIAIAEGSVLPEAAFGLSLVSVRKGSAAYGLYPIEKHNEDVTVSAFETLARGTKDPKSLPRKASTAITRVQDFSTRNSVVLEFRPRAGDRAQVWTVKPKATLKRIIQEATLCGETDIYGTLESVGGAEPKARMRLDNDKSVTFSPSKVQAKALAQHLYDRVGVRGIATWNAKTNDIINFKIIEVLNYRQTPVAEAFAEIREALGSCFDHIDDVNRAISNHRHGE